MSTERVAESPTVPEQVAAVDLGSNSFHMVVARPAHGRLQLVDRLRERVALAEGLDAQGRLTPEATERALACLDRFKQRLGQMPRAAVRAVGTSALRQAKNSRGFLRAARERLGYPIDVVGGLEEARLIYLGVSHTHGDLPARRLVIDVGGGSTECILGEGFTALVSDSFRMGCIGYSRRYFADGSITRAAMRHARLEATVELQDVAKRYRELGWDGCLGASGTVQAVHELLASNDSLTEDGWSPSDGIRPRHLRNLRRLLIERGHAEALDLPGLSPDRAPVLAGGVAILSGVFDSFGIEELHPAQGALREGLLYDLLGRIRHEDVRDTTIQSLSKRYHLDATHAARVRVTAAMLLEAVREAWQLESPGTSQVLAWAAQLFELGLSIAYSGHHKHGAYIVAHADLPGFTSGDQELLSALLLNHRRKTRKSTFEDLPDPRTAERLCCLLRLAVLLHRSRSPDPLPALDVRASEDGLELGFPEGWLEEHSLTAANLAEEQPRQAALDVALSFRS